MKDKKMRDNRIKIVQKIRKEMRDTVDANMESTLPHTADLLKKWEKELEDIEYYIMSTEGI